jgi:hypothetical protein
MATPVTATAELVTAVMVTADRTADTGITAITAAASAETATAAIAAGTVIPAVPTALVVVIQSKSTAGIGRSDLVPGLVWTPRVAPPHAGICAIYAGEMAAKADLAIAMRVAPERPLQA